MVVKETLVICDDCSDNGSGGDDRDLTATEIRKRRKVYGWIQRGSKDYCDNCAPKHSKQEKSNA